MQTFDLLCIVFHQRIKSNTMTKEELLQLKAQLPDGAMTAIGKESGLEVSLISRVLTGHNPKFDKKTKVINAVVDYVEKLQAGEAKATERARAVLNKSLEIA